ncbi:APC family permease [uncultured Thiohalocapsa sp.]|uniref:APC family permease n=1 Tax=uncultured Thiohalocapsa sp. TaxID=768990 RepID=UPI0025F2CA30|nr:APC family permease [uncultured Thiohalocapsa sp.]
MTSASLGQAPQSFGLRAATLLVVANMIGTGVFTTLGLQAEGVQDGAALLLLWLLGGLVAACGALVYAELAAALPRSGGEYIYLSRSFGLSLGLIAGWVSATVGFAAPVALAAMAFAQYAATVLPVAPTPTAVVAVIAIAALHAFDVRLGTRFQVLMTLLKVVAVLFFCAAGLLLPAAPDALVPLPNADTAAAVLSPAFALSLVYVSYAYSGWNAATYVAAEVRSPQRLVPRALLLGTALVTLMYLLLNWVFLRSVPLEALAGTVEVGALSARWLFGEGGGRLMSAMLALLLLSTMSAMLLAGPRVFEAMAVDCPAMGLFGARNRRGAPTRAVLFSLALALGLIVTGTFAAVLAFAGFTLMLSSLLTVLGALRLRRTEPMLPRPFRIPWYPWPPLIYLCLTTAALLVVAWSSPLPVVLGLSALGAWWWWLERRPG